MAAAPVSAIVSISCSLSCIPTSRLTTLHDAH